MCNPEIIEEPTHQLSTFLITLPKEKEASFLISNPILSCLENHNDNLSFHTHDPFKKNKTANDQTSHC